MDIVSILHGLLHNSNDIRRQVEVVLEKNKRENPASLMHSLIDVLLQHVNENGSISRDGAIQTMACVLLRGFAVRESSMWLSIDLSTARRRLLEQLVAESSSPFLQRKMADMLCPLAKLSDWPEIFITVENLSQSNVVEQRRLGLHLLNKLCEHTAAFIIANGAVVKRIISSNITNIDINTQCYAALALCSYLHEVASIEEEDCNLLNHIPPLLARCLFDGHSRTSETMEILSAVSQLAAEKASVFAYSWTSLLESLAQLCSVENGTEVDETVKSTALEIAATLITTKQSACFCKNNSTVSSFLNICVSHMAFFDESEEESSEFLSGVPSSDSNEFDDNDNSNHLAANAAQCLILFATKLNHHEVLDTCLPLAGQLIASADWRSQRAALLVLHFICEGTAASLYKSLPHIVPIILSCIESAESHPRLQYTAINCIFEFVAIFNGELEDKRVGDEEDKDKDEEEDENGDIKLENKRTELKCIQKIFPSEIPATMCRYLQSQSTSFPTSNSSVAVRSMILAIRSLVSFFDPDRCSKATCKPFAAGLLDFGLTLFQTQSNYPVSIRQECAYLLANVASLSPVKVLSNRYKLILREFEAELTTPASDTTTSVSSSHQNDLGVLRGRALEATAIIGKVIGKKAFYGDAMKLMTYLSGLHQQGLDFSDAWTSYVMQSCARFATILEDDFEPFIPHILPPLLAMLREPLVIESFDAQGNSDSVNRSIHSGHEDVILNEYVRGYGEFTIKFNSHQILEKEGALRSLYQYLLDIPHLLWTYCPSIIEAVSHILDSPASTDDLYTIVCAILSEAIREFLRMSFLSQQCNDAESDSMPTETISKLVQGPIYLLLQGMERCQAVKSHRMQPSTSVQILFDGLRDYLNAIHDHGKENWGIVFDEDLSRAIIGTVSNEVAIWIQRKYVDKIVQNREEDIKAEEDTWVSIIDCCGWLIKINGVHLMKDFFIDDFLTLIKEILSCHYSASGFLLQFPVCTLLDIIDHIEPLSSTSATMLLPVLLQHMDDDDLLVSGIFGIGTIAMRSENILISHSNSITNILYHACGIGGRVHSDLFRTELDDDQEKLFIDNGVSALFKVLLFQPTVLPANDLPHLMSFVLSNLPIKNDVFEARACHQLLVQRIMAADGSVMGDQFANIPKIVEVLVQLIVSIQSSAEDADNAGFWSAQIVNEETVNQCVVILRMGVSGAAGIPPKIFTDVLQKMPPHIQRVVTSCIAAADSL